MRKKTLEEINEKIKERKAVVLTAEEMARLVKEKGAEEAFKQVDVVTTATFGAMCSSGVLLNFGHSDPPIKMTRVWLNDVPAYTGIAAVDAYLGATEPSEKFHIHYGGAQVIEDLVRRKPVVLRAEAYGTDCYPRKSITTTITIDDLNQAIMLNPRNAYQKYNAATNSGSKTLFTYMGKLLPQMTNVTFSGAGELSPLMNDPDYETIGLGTRIFLAGAEGYIIGHGTQHSPENGFATLMVKGHLKEMSPEFLRAAVFEGYGCTLYLGLGVPIPVLNPGIARKTGISDEKIFTNLVDYSFPTRNRPVLKKVTYAELKSGWVEVNGKKIKASPLSSLFMARKIARLLKEKIRRGEFFLTLPVERLPGKSTTRTLDIKEAPVEQLKEEKRDIPEKARMYKDDSLCFHCGHCLSLCPAGVFVKTNRWEIKAQPERCTGCGLCLGACPASAILVRK